MIAVLLPLLIFGGLYYGQGTGGILLGLLLGAILSAVYLWKRNLPAVMIAHFLIQVVPNFAMPLLRH